MRVKCNQRWSWAAWRRSGTLATARLYDSRRRTSARLVRRLDVRLEARRVDLLRLDAHGYARLGRIPERVGVRVQVLLRQAVDLRVRAVLRQLGASRHRH